ncbi:hypothetical protein V8C44DRAFT_360302 [Trichoderma aethiopicum]
MVINPPRPDPQAVTYSGQWMHTVLRDVIIAMISAPTTPLLYGDNTDHQHPYGNGMGYAFGNSTATDSDYRFVPSAASQWTWTGRSLQRLRDYFGGLQPSTSMTFTLKWNMYIVLATVEDGKVVFDVTGHSVSSQGTLDPSSNLHWGEPVQSLAKGFGEYMDKSIDTAIVDATIGSQNALADQHRLYLPAKGYFLMHDPVFNNSGELLVEMEYNGAPPPPPPPQ